MDNSEVDAVTSGLGKGVELWKDFVNTVMNIRVP